MSFERPPTPRELLAFYLEAGVDCALSDEAPDRLSEAASPAIERPASARSSLLQPPGPPVARGDVAPTPDIAIANARELAPTAKTLDDLRALVEAFDGCPLKATANRLVFADGNPAARLMLVGEAPGSDEDKAGLPFVGRSGKLLDLILAAIGHDRSSAYIANVIPWRPPGNRDPSPQETQICLPFIKRQIELCDPDVLVCLGKPSSQAILNVKDGIVKSRGRWIDYDTGSRTIRAIATFHPAYLLRQPIHKGLVWRDFLAVKKQLAQG